jgi:hypothetical protein
VGHGHGAGEGWFAERLADGAREVLLGHALFGLGQAVDHGSQPAEVALLVPGVDAQIAERALHLGCRRREVGEHAPQRGSGPLAEDAALAQHADCGGRVLEGDAQTVRDRTGVAHRVVDVGDGA